MTIETKFNMGDVVFVLSANKVHEVQIIGVYVQYSDKIEQTDNRGYICDITPRQYVTYRVKYHSGGESIFEETNIFATKQDLLNSL